MIDYDMHIHTEYCKHAPGMTVEAICAAADEAGLDTIGITDHVFEPGGLGVIERIRAEVANLKSNCKVIVGAEVDVDGDFDDGRLVTDDIDDIDYVIAGFHYIPAEGSYPFSPDDCPLEPERFFSLWRKSLFGIVTNPKVDTLAHPGRLAAAALDMDVYFEDVLGVFEAAAKLSAANNIAWEINELTGTRLSFTYQQQWYRIYKIATEAGVKLVYGSDAHEPLAIGRQLFTNMVLEKLPAGSLAGPDKVVRSNK